MNKWRWWRANLLQCERMIGDGGQQFEATTCEWVFANLSKNTLKFHRLNRFKGQTSNKTKWNRDPNLDRWTENDGRGVLLCTACLRF
jgi:hypothetical protein